MLKCPQERPSGGPRDEGAAIRPCVETCHRGGGIWSNGLPELCPRVFGSGRAPGARREQGCTDLGHTDHRAWRHYRCVAQVLQRGFRDTSPCAQPTSLALHSLCCALMVCSVCVCGGAQELIRLYRLFDRRSSESEDGTVSQGLDEEESMRAHPPRHRLRAFAPVYLCEAGRARQWS